MTFEDWLEQHIPGASVTKQEIHDQLARLTYEDNDGEDSFSLYMALKDAYEAGQKDGH